MTRAPSAKPLFKAISGKGRAKAAPAGTMFGDLPDQTRTVEAIERRAEDFYPTGQPEAIRALFAYDGERIRDQFVPSVWEPACGDGALVREIRAMGVRCIATDLIDRGCPDSSVADFYAATRSPARAIITNPPFCEISSKGRGRWLRHTLAMPGWDYLALLLSWEWPAARANGLGQLLDEQPFSRCYLMRWKLDFTGEGNPAQRNAWFVWDKRDPRGPAHPKLYPDFPDDGPDRPATGGADLMARLDLTFAPRLMPTPQAAAYLGVSESTLRMLDIPRKVLGRKRLYDRFALDEFASDLPTEHNEKENTCDAVFGV